MIPQCLRHLLIICNLDIGHQTGVWIRFFHHINHGDGLIPFCQKARSYTEAISNFVNPSPNTLAWTKTALVPNAAYPSAISCTIAGPKPRNRWRRTPFYYLIIFIVWSRVSVTYKLHVLFNIKENIWPWLYSSQVYTMYYKYRVTNNDIKTFSFHYFSVHFLYVGRSASRFGVHF